MHTEEIATIDILTVDVKIQAEFKRDRANIQEYREKLDDVISCVGMKHLNGRVLQDLRDTREKLREKIRKIESEEDFNFYTMETFDILGEYRKILETPIRMNFSGKVVKNTEMDGRKEELMHKYLEIAQKYTQIDNPINKKHKLMCDNCQNTKNFEVIESNVYVCLKCFSQQTIFKNITSYNDIDRVNMSSKYTYDRKVHFRDCINQFQGDGLYKISISFLLDNVGELWLAYQEFSPMRGRKLCNFQYRFILKIVWSVRLSI